MPRFVVLHHQMPPESRRLSHWDWMFERQECLITWETLPLKGFELGEKLNWPPSVNCRKLSDHRLSYLDFAGPISGNRGSVSQVMSGTYKSLSESDSLATYLLEIPQPIGDIVLEIDKQKPVFLFAKP